MKNSFLQFLSLVKRSGNLIEGYNRCKEIMGKKKIHLFIFSEELSIRSKNEFVEYCKTNSIPYIEGISKSELGLSIGREEINILCILDKNMSDKLIKCYHDNYSNS